VVATAPLSREQRDELRRLIDQRRRDTLRGTRSHSARLGGSGRAASGSPIVVTPNHSWPLYSPLRGTPLTRRQRDVLELRRAGLTHSAIAERLGISRQASAQHLSHARKRLE
jgi:DNA-binding NarL/FixJ family response regulator